MAKPNAKSVVKWLRLHGEKDRADAVDALRERLERLRKAGIEYRDALQKPEHPIDQIGVQRNQKRLIEAQRSFYAALQKNDDE